MPIYEYRCNSCGAEKEHLQKMNDAAIPTCPACNSNDYIKLISAAGFQLKGSGWYVTDFKNNNKKPDSPKKEKSETATAPAAATTASSSSSSSANKSVSPTPAAD